MNIPVQVGRSTLLSFVLCFGAWLSGCATNPVTGERDFVLMSESQEIALGRKYNAQVLKELPVYEDAELAAYVQRVGAALAAKSHRSNLIYRFTILDDTQVNAFALPGGYIYITRGLLAYLNSEAELAAVLGHEIGHVTARHSVRQHSASTATGILGAVIASAAGVEGGQDLANIVGTAVVRGYGRTHELEADRLGAEYLARTGYDPQAMLRVIGVLKNQEEFDKQLAREEGREPRAYHGLFSTHPANDRRLQEVVAAAERFRQPSASHVRRDVLLGHLDGLVFGDSEREGVRRGNRFYHRKLDFALSFPQGWRVENRTDRLLAFPPGKDALIEVTLEDLNRRIPPRRFISERLGISDLRQGRPLRPAGAEGYTGITRAGTPFGSVPTRIAVLYHGERALVFKGAARSGTLDQAFLDTATSYHRLTKAERDLARPQHLQIVTAKPGSRYATLARSSPIPNHPEAQLRLLNGDYPSGEPGAGARIKVVR